MTTLKNTITTRAQLDNLAQEHGFSTYLLSDDLQACNLDDIKEVLQVSNNYLFISNHTLKKSDVELYHKIKREFEQVKSATTENTNPKTKEKIVVPMNILRKPTKEEIERHDQGLNELRGLFSLRNK